MLFFHWDELMSSGSFAVDTLGTVSILVNNAGIGGGVQTLD